MTFVYHECPNILHALLAQILLRVVLHDHLIVILCDWLAYRLQKYTIPVGISSDIQDHRVRIP